MTTLITTKAKLLFVEVPEDACEFQVYNHYNPIIFDFWKSPDSFDEQEIELPSGSTYTFLFTTKQATEEDWKPLVRELPIGARYENYCGDYPIWYHTATESGLSLQKSHGMDVNKNYAVIKID